MTGVEILAEKTVADASLSVLSDWPNIKHVLYLQFEIVDTPTQSGAVK